MDQRIVGREIESRTFVPEGSSDPLHPDNEVFRYKLKCGHAVESFEPLHDRSGADVKVVDCEECDAAKAAAAAPDASSTPEASKKSSKKSSTSE